MPYGHRRVLPAINFTYPSMAILGGDPLQHLAGNRASCTNLWGITDRWFGLTSGFVRLTMWLDWLCGFDWLDRLLDSTPLIVSGDSQSCGNKSEYVVTRPCIPLDCESPLTITHNDLG